MGWLGWSEPVALGSDVNSISLAMDGRLDMLKAIFGSKEEAPRQGPITADSWKALVRRNNSRYRQPRQQH